MELGRPEEGRPREQGGLTAARLRSGAGGPTANGQRAGEKEEVMGKLTAWFTQAEKGRKVEVNVGGGARRAATMAAGLVGRFPVGEELERLGEGRRSFGARRGRSWRAESRWGGGGWTARTPAAARQQLSLARARAGRRGRREKDRALERIRTRQCGSRGSPTADAWWSSPDCAGRGMGACTGVAEEHCGVANEISLILTAQNSKFHIKT